MAPATDDDNRMSRTECATWARLPGFDLESVAFTAMAGWVAGSHFVGN